MAGNVNEGRNLQNQQDLTQQQQGRAQKVQGEEFASSIPETNEADVEFIPDQNLEEKVEES